MWLVHGSTGLPYKMYFREVIARTHLVSGISIIIPLALVIIVPPSITRLLLSCILCVLSAGITSFYIGLTGGERSAILLQFKKVVNKYV